MDDQVITFEEMHKNRNNCSPVKCLRCNHADMLHVERSLFLLGEPLHTHLLRTDSQRQPQQPYYRQPPFHFPVTDMLPLAFVTEI